MCIAPTLVRQEQGLVFHFSLATIVYDGHLPGFDLKSGEFKHASAACRSLCSTTEQDGEKKNRPCEKNPKNLTADKSSKRKAESITEKMQQDRMLSP